VTMLGSGNESMASTSFIFICPSSIQLTSADHCSVCSSWNACDMFMALMKTSPKMTFRSALSRLSIPSFGNVFILTVVEFAPKLAPI